MPTEKPSAASGRNNATEVATTAEVADYDSRQQTLTRMLEETYPEILELYQAGLHLLESASFPARADLLGHVIREIRRRLPNAIVPKGDPTPDPSPRLRALLNDWEPVSAELNKLKTGDTIQPTIAIPTKLAGELDQIFMDEKIVSSTLRERFLRMCAIINSEGLKWSGNELLAKEWNAIKAEGIAHGGATRHDADRRAEELFRQQEAILLRIFEYAQERKNRIMQLAAETTAATLTDDLKELVTLTDALTFYRELAKPELLPALHSRGIFRITEPNSAYYWPPAEYLINVAAESPGDVAYVLKGLPPVIAQVTRTLLIASLKLPDSLLEAVAREAPWFTKAKPLFGIADPYFQVIRRLASAESSAAVKSSLKFLDLESEPPSVAIPGFDHPRAVPACGQQFFRYVLEYFNDSLQDADPFEVLTALAAAIDRTAKIEAPDGQVPRTLWAGSLINLPTYGDDVKTLLLQSALVFINRAANQDWNRTVAFLRERKRNQALYQRILMYLIWRHGTKTHAAELLCDEQLWIASNPEHVGVVERFFPELDSNDRATIVQIARSAVAGALDRWYDGRKTSSDELQRAIGFGVIARFGSVADRLPSEYAELIAERDAAASVSQPLTYEVLRAMAPEKVAQALKNSSAAAAGFDFWNVGAALRAAVQTEAAPWLANQALLDDVPDEYLGWLLNGLFSYTRSHSIDVTILLDICVRGLSRVELLWGSSKDQELQAAQHIMQSVGMILLDCADNAADPSALSVLTDAARRLSKLSVLKADRAAAPSPWSAANAALSNAHGIAVHLAAQILVKAYEAGIDYSETIEIYDELSSRCEIPVRGALGQFFARFASVGENRETWSRRVFCSGDEPADSAAWSGYVVFSQINELTYKLLRSVYEKRLADLAEVQHQYNDSGNAVPPIAVQEATIRDIWILMANGVESLDEPQSLPSRMLDVVNPSLMERLLEQIAMSLPEGDDAEARRIYDAAMALWDHVAARIDEGRMDDTLLRAIPRFLRVNSLPYDWRFRQAEYLAEKFSHTSISDWQLVKDIRVLAVYDRPRSLRILLRLAKTTNIAILPSIQMYAGPLLRTAYASDSSEERALVSQIISILVSNQRPNILEDTSSDMED